MWRRDLGLPPEIVAERVNSAIQTIEEYYDHQTARLRLERRRRQYVGLLEVDEE